MSGCRDCRFCRIEPDYDFRHVSKYHFGIRFWLFEHQTFERFECGTRAGCYALPDRTEVTDRADIACSLFEGVKE
jgi:hypothetical protein